MGILAFLIILSLLVFVHELGHFFTARRLGIAVEEFGFGLPPRAIGKKIGNTIYSLNWIPLGGFVRIKGEQGEDPDDDDSFVGRPVWQRALVISAGVIMNAVFAAVLLSVGFMVGTPQIIDGQDLAGATVADREVRVASVLKGYPADVAEIEPGDTILAIDDFGITSIGAMQAYLNETTSDTVSVRINRDGEELSKELPLAVYEEESAVGDDSVVLSGETRNVIGVELITTGIVSYGFFSAVTQGFITAGVLLKDITFAFGQVIYDLAVGEEVSVDLSGPVGIAVITTEVARLGFIYLIQFSALLSLNLAIINFIPFPALDGGRFIFLILEKIKGSAINQKTEAIIHNVGFGLLMVLILVVTVRDLTQLNFWERLTSSF